MTVTNDPHLSSHRTRTNAVPGYPPLPPLNAETATGEEPVTVVLAA
ncbi:hypothetical protein [Curtobacterium sp. MCBD17_040]|nr:hypothetical protein [Curtobacterium sp. MCBD17_040]WIB65300.1 hypothetical protein DEI94_18005 [Curtobacterium sp. MCBD17_040]